MPYDIGIQKLPEMISFRKIFASSHYIFALRTVLQFKNMIEYDCILKIIKQNIKRKVTILQRS